MKLIEYLIFYDKNSSLVFDSIGRNPEFPGMKDEDATDFIGMYLSFLSNNDFPDTVIKKKEYVIKTKPYVFGVTNKGSVISIIKGDYDINAVSSFKLENCKNLYLDSFIEIKNNIKDEELISGCEYAELETDVKKVFKNYKSSFDYKNFNNFKNNILKKLINHTETYSNLYQVIKENLDEKISIIYSGLDNYTLIQKMLDFYNNHTNSYVFNPSSLIYDFGFSKILTNIISLNKELVEKKRKESFNDYFKRIKKSVKIKDYTNLSDISINLTV